MFIRTKAIDVIHIKKKASALNLYWNKISTKNMLKGFLSDTTEIKDCYTSEILSVQQLNAFLCCSYDSESFSLSESLK